MHPLEKLKHPDFSSADRTLPVQDNGHPSATEWKIIPNLEGARPFNFFNLMITPRFVEKVMVACTNQKAASEGAGVGGTLYKDFVQFDVPEMYRFMGLLFANGLAPKPDILSWFETTRTDPLLGNDWIAPQMNKKLPHGGSVPGVRRWRHLRRFLCLYDFRMHTKEVNVLDPLWKVRLLLKELNKQSREMWVTGKHVSIDEQTIGFKGTSSMALRISYKKEGDGFQCDAVCDRGYTFAFYFRHGEPPKLMSTFDDLKLPPTARRVVWLAQQLPNYWTRIYMDNLFNSRKLFSALFRAKALAHGVTRTSGRGFPPSVVQQEEKNTAHAEQLRGTTKAAVLKDSADTPDMLAASVYDTKPVHIMSMVSDSVEWLAKQRKVWSAKDGVMRTMTFLRLNMIDDYNQFMNSTDIADQLRNTYRPDYWMRNRKWWWSIFLWALGVAKVNAYKLYVEMHDAEKRAKRERLPPKWSHREFIQELVIDMMKISTITSNKRSSSEMEDDNSLSVSMHTSVHSSSGNGAANDNDDDDDEDDFFCDSGIVDVLKKYKPHSITEKRMKTNFFLHRLDAKQHPSLPTESRCQYCHYQFTHEYGDDLRRSNALQKQNRKHVRRCVVCNVNLCPDCDLEFHGVRREDLKKYFSGK